jgi:hypothetical protein
MHPTSHRSFQTPPHTPFSPPPNLPPEFPFLGSWAVTFISHGGVKALSESLAFYDKKPVKTDNDIEVAVELLRCAGTGQAGAVCGGRGGSESMPCNEL